MEKRDFLNLGVTDLLNKAVAERLEKEQNVQHQTNAVSRRANL